jgi:RNA polymerase sigma factor (sigma-70 family)
MAHNPLSDDDLAATHADGVQERLLDSLDQLYETYEPSVERWVRRLAGPGADVEDLVHDVFLVALRRRHEFRGDAKLSTWLFRITERIVRKRRFRQRVHGFLNLVFRDSTAALAPASPTPLEELERRQQCALLYDALRNGSHCRDGARTAGCSRARGGAAFRRAACRAGDWSGHVGACPFSGPSVPYQAGSGVRTGRRDERGRA